MANFGSLSIGISGLYANRMGLEVTSHNIANADNAEYIRQRVSYKDSPLRVSGEFKVGTGTDVQGIKQIRDEFLDIKLRNQVSEYGYWGEKYNIFNQVDSIINETGQIDDKVTGGLAKTMNDFWKSMEELAKDPANLTVRGVFKERAEGFVTTARHMYDQLDTLQKNLNTRVKSIVDETNKISTQLADLNKEIVSREASGISANDYRDKRNGLIDRLSQIMEISVSEDSNGYVNVAVAGTHIVLENSAKQLEYRDNPKGQRVDVYWKGETEKISLEKELKSGELKAVLEARGSEDDTAPTPADGLKNLIPTMKGKLNELVRTVAEAINNQQMDGYTLDGTKAGPNSGSIEIVPGKKQIISFDKSDAKNATKLSIKYDYDGVGLNTTATLNGNVITIKLGTDPTKNTATEIQKVLNDLDLSSVGVENEELITVEGDDIGAISNVTDLIAKATVPNQISTIKIFTTDDGDDINAGNIKLNINSLNDIAASTSANEHGNGKNAEAILKLRDALIYSGGKLNIDDFYRDVISDFGIGGQESRNMMEAHGRIIIELDNKKQSISAVSLDEEMGNMLKFQHAYSASTRFINAIDEMLDVIINRMGR